MRYIFLKPIKTTEEKRNAAALPRMSKADLQKLIGDRTETKVVTAKTAAASRAKSAAFRQALRADLARDLGRSNHSLAGLLKLRPAAITSTPTIKEGDRKFKLLSPESILTDAYCHAKLRLNAVHAMQKLTWLYNTVEQAASKDLSKKQRDALKKFAPAPNLKLADISKRIQGLAALCEGWRPAMLAGLVGVAEQGGGRNTDQTPIRTRCPNQTPNPKGLITVCNWPLKPHMTSVKDQGNRGTCSAFGAVAAVEMAVSIKYGQRLNLSEQDLYKHQRFDWNPNPFDDYYDDGYTPLLSMLFQMVSGYVFPFEKDWNYNQSMSRVDDEPHHKYTRSCDGYTGRACSDTNHQAEKVCRVIRTTELKEVVSEVCEFAEGIPLLGIIAGWVCNVVTEVIEIVDETEVCVFETEVNGTSRIKATGFFPVWDPIWDNDIAAAKTLLRARVPLIFCFTVPDSWQQSKHSATNGRGFIVHSASEKAPSDAGGHCVQLVGCIDNADLPASASISPGAGGGYFIVKNSWSECWGDMGFAYVPYSWVDKWGTNIVAITNVERI